MARNILPDKAVGFTPNWWAYFRLLMDELNSRTGNAPVLGYLIAPNVGVVLGDDELLMAISHNIQGNHIPESEDITVEYIVQRSGNALILRGLGSLAVGHGASVYLT